MEIFHKRIKAELKRNKISQSELARKLGVKQSSVWEWLNISTPSLERFKQISEILNVSADTLLGLEEIGEAAKISLS